MSTATPVPVPAVSDVQPHVFTFGGEEVLILRRCNKDHTSRFGFVYPSGVGSVVEAPTEYWGKKDSKPCELKLGWDASASCGQGLHGWPWGFGLGDGQTYDLDDLWLVIGAKPADVVGNLDDGWKCKFRAGVIRYEGNFAGALAMLRDGFHACIKAMATVPAFAVTPSTTCSGEKFAQLASSGDGAQLASSGDGAQLASSGTDSVAAITAADGRIKVGERGAFAIPFFTHDDGWTFLTGKVGVDGIKANTWYEVRKGKLAEVEASS